MPPCHWFQSVFAAILGRWLYEFEGQVIVYQKLLLWGFNFGVLKLWWWCQFSFPTCDLFPFPNHPNPSCPSFPFSLFYNNIISLSTLPSPISFITIAFPYHSPNPYIPKSDCLHISSLDKLHHPLFPLSHIPHNPISLWQIWHWKHITYFSLSNQSNIHIAAPWQR